MHKLIAIDDGHSPTTPGKRTPTFPDTQTFMHENEFNRVVAEYLKINLERCGFKTLMVAPTDADTPLNVRVDTANNANADFYISIHANALNGTWGKQEGVSTYHYPSSLKSKKAASTIQNNMLWGTEQKDRGVLTAPFYVLKHTQMPAVLVECAFMDNLREANLLLSDVFRHECADEICRGICEYFDVAYITNSTYRVEGITHVVEIDPMALKVSLTNGSSAKNWINGNFFNGNKTIGWMASDGKILCERNQHKKFLGLYDKPKGTLIVRKNGSVEVGFKTDAQMDAIRNDIWFCCQGFNLFPFDLKKEGFSYGAVAYTTNRVSIGHNEAKNKIVLAIRTSSNAERAIQTMNNLGCGGSAICLDGGGSVNFRYNGVAHFKTSRALTNVIYWR